MAISDKLANTQSVITQLQNNIHSAIGPLFPASGEYALLDFPNHANVGDSAIWLGELEYFKRHFDATPSYVSQNARHCSESLRKAIPQGTLFLHGGGNFGDIWPKHQLFREQIIKEFPDRPIVQLPQSIHFQDPAMLQQAKLIINAHPNFTLLVRDHKSLAIAQENFTCKIKLSPDMAFALGDQTGLVTPTRDLLLLLRTDSEKAPSQMEGVQIPSSEDWLDEDSTLEAKTRKEIIFSLPFKLGIHAFNKNAQRELLFRRLAQIRVLRGLMQIQSARFVITDRLHTHILSLLSHRPHIALDNSYGKISNFIEAWTKESLITQRAQTLDEALRSYRAQSVSV